MKLFAMFAASLTAASCATVSGAPADAESLSRPPEASSMNHYLYAIVLQNQGKFEESLEEMQRAAEEADAPLAIWLRLVMGYYRIGDYENALAMVEEAVKEAPQEASLYTLMGRINERLGRDDEAADAYRKAMQMNPDDASLYDAVISTEIRSNDVIGAIEVLEGLIELRPDQANFYFRLGLLKLEINDFDGAAHAFERVLELEPDNDNATYRLGIVRLLQDDFAAAERLMSDVLDTPDEAPSAPRLHIISLARGGRADEAIDALEARERAGRAGDDEKVGLMYLAWLHGRYELATEVVPPRDAPHYATVIRALSRMGQGRPYGSLVETFDEIEGDLDFEVSEYFTQISLYAGDESLVNDFIPAIERIRGDGDTSKRLAIIHGRLLASVDELEKARDIYEGVLDRHGSDFLVHTYLATVYDELDNFAMAERHLENALELRPNDHNTMNTLGYLYAEENVQLDKAEELLKRALDLDPDNPFYLDSLGWVYYRKGDADNALEYIQQAIYEMDTDDPILRDHLGDAYHLKGQTERAVEQWERAYRLDSELEGVREKIERFKQSETE